VSPLSGLERTAARLAGALASRGGRHGSLLVLTYHRVLLEPDPLLPGEPDVVEFAAQMDMLAGCSVSSGFRKRAERLVRRSLPPRAMCITFDDGYANNCEVAAASPSRARHSGHGVRHDRLLEWRPDVQRYGDRSDPAGRGGTGPDIARTGTARVADVAARRRTIDQVLPTIKHLDPEERQARAERIAKSWAPGYRMI